MCNGYMRISRKIENWGWYRDSNTFRVFFHLLLKAQYQDGADYMGLPLKRGQVVMGRKKLSADLGISEQSVRTSLERLSKSQEITIKSTNRFSIITICNYDSWQGDTLSSNQQTNQQLTNDKGVNQPTTNHYKINNNKEIINKEEDANASKKNETADSLPLFPEEEVKPEEMTEKMKIATFNYAGFKDFFNNILKEHASRISQIKKLDERRKNTLHARMMDYGVDALYEVMTKVVNSKFLNGGSKTGWKADFDWIFGPDNFRKIYEGKYDDREETLAPEEPVSTINWQS